MKFLDTEGVRQLKELNDAAYVGKEEYNDDTMVISAALNDLNSRLTDAEADIYSIIYDKLKNKIPENDELYEHCNSIDVRSS